MNNDPTEGLDKNDTPHLKLGQEVRVVSGKHRGRKGTVHGVRSEGDSLRIELLAGDERLFVDQSEIDFKFEAAEVSLFMPEGERAEWFARLKELEEGY